MTKILSITPNTTGAFAKYRDCEPGPKSDYYESIICWALVKEEDGETYIRGVSAMQDGLIDFVDEVSNFAGYFHKIPPGIEEDQVN